MNYRNIKFYQELSEPKSDGGANVNGATGTSEQVCSGARKALNSATTVKLSGVLKFTFGNLCSILWRDYDGRKMALSLFATAGLFSAIGLISVGGFSPSVMAEGSSASASVNVTSVCSMTTTGGNVYTASITGGDSAEVTGSSIKTLCSDGGGYAIYATGYTGDTIGGENSTKLVGNNVNIATGTGTSGDNSTWSMKLATGGNNYLATLDNGYGNYNVIPSAYTKVAHYNTSTIDPSSTSPDAEGNGSILNVSYQVYISPTQLADTYAGKVKYTLVHPASEVPPHAVACPSDKICYNPNTTTAVGTMGQQNVATSDTSATLLASNFSRTGYGFAGWSDVYDYATNPNAKFYGPQEYITFTAGQYTGTNNGLSLYAVWVKSAGSLQDTNTVSSVCSGLTTAPTDGTANLSSVSALTDQRDNQTYAIAKLADGKCWMIENLRLENTAEHNSDGTLAQGYGTSATYGNFSGLADPEAPSLFSNVTTANSLYSTDGSNDTVNIGTSNASFRFPRYNNVNHPTNASDRPQNPTTNSATNSTSNAGMYSYGNYYTWHAAIADLTPNNTDNQSTTSTSLCPAGWHLPQGGRKANVSVSDFWILSRAAIGADPANFADDSFNYTGTPEGVDASNALRAYPNNFVYSGYVYNVLVRDRGSNGDYWSSTANSSYNAYVLYLYSSSVGPGTFRGNKFYGRTIRCVAPSA